MALTCSRIFSALDRMLEWRGVERIQPAFRCMFLDFLGLVFDFFPIFLDFLVGTCRTVGSVVYVEVSEVSFVVFLLYALWHGVVTPSPFVCTHSCKTRWSFVSTHCDALTFCVRIVARRLFLCVRIVAWRLFLCLRILVRHVGPSKKVGGRPNGGSG